MLLRCHLQEGASRKKFFLLNVSLNHMTMRLYRKSTPQTDLQGGPSPVMGVITGDYQKERENPLSLMDNIYTKWGVLRSLLEER